MVEDLSDGGADDPGAEQPGDEHHIPPDSSKMTVTVNTNSIRVHLNVIKSSDDGEPELSPHAHKHVRRSRIPMRRRQGRSADTGDEPEFRRDDVDIVDGMRSYYRMSVRTKKGRGWLRLGLSN